MPSKYEQVADDLRERARAGEFTPGARLPSETELAASFGVSVPTIRQAVRVLRDEGLIESQHGRGTFVRAGGWSGHGDITRWRGEGRVTGMLPAQDWRAAFVDEEGVPETTIALLGWILEDDELVGYLQDPVDHRIVRAGSRAGFNGYRSVETVVAAVSGAGWQVHYADPEDGAVKVAPVALFLVDSHRRVTPHYVDPIEGAIYPADLHEGYEVHPLDRGVAED